MTTTSHHPTLNPTPKPTPKPTLRPALRLAPAGPSSEPPELLCSFCAEPIRHAPPDYYLTSNPDRVPRYSHRDGTGLCWHPDGTPATVRPREVRRAPAGGPAARVRGLSPGWGWAA